MNNLSMLALAAIAIYVMKRWSVETAILNVYLPAMVLIPSFYGMRIPHLPGINCQGIVLLPILVVVLCTRIQFWQFRLSDLLIVLFPLEAGYSEYLNTGFGNGFFNFSGHCEVVLLPYLLGRIMLEQPEFREKFVRRFVLLVAIACVLSIPEFLTGKNIFYIAGRRFFTEGFVWGNQPRYGFIRMKGPFAGSIHAGLAIVVAIILTLWMRTIDRVGNLVAEPVYFRLRRSTWLLIALCIGSAMTISRGPWLGLVVALVVSRIGKSKTILRTAAITAVLCLVGGIALQIEGNEYTSGDSNSMSEAQQSAAYRKVAFKLYEPIAKKGGYFGWGIVMFPKVKGMDSIDNEYLLLRVSQGKLGYWLFLAFFLDAAVGIVRATMKSGLRHDTYFYLCLGGILAGLAFTFSTVFLTGQTAVLLFMIFGWVQSLQQTPPPYGYTELVTASPYSFKRVFA